MPATTTQISPAQIVRYSELIYDRTGIRISEKKQSLISNRLRLRMKANNLSCYEDYLELLTGSGSEEEWNALYEVITTHQTHLFRDQCQWDWFSKEYLPELDSQAVKKERNRELKIWSAACSTGDEAYTFACNIAGTLNFPKAWEIDILGTDIAQETLRTAEKASFDEQAMRCVPENWKQLFFLPDDDKGWSPSELLKKWTRFELHNLMNPLPESKFDLVCLKNVLIYFDKSSKQVVMDNLYKSLKPGGYLLTGPAEGVANFVGRYERCRPWLFVKSAGSMSNKAGN